MVPGYYAMGLRAYTSSIATVAPALSLRWTRPARPATGRRWRS